MVKCDAGKKRSKFGQMRSDPKQPIAQKPPIGWRGYGLLFSSRTLSPTALSLPVSSVTGTMPCDPWPSYEEAMYKRLEESLFEYVDEDTIKDLVPAIKRFFVTELARRRKEVSTLEAVMAELFPGQGYDNAY